MSVKEDLKIKRRLFIQIWERVFLIQEIGKISFSIHVDYQLLAF